MVAAPRLAIVGAGFSALSLLRQLVDLRAPLGETWLFGRPDEFATGPAYGLQARDALLNTRAADLGLVPQRPGEFADWVGLEGSARDAFLPRRLYGAHLRESLIVSQAQSPFPVRVHAEQVDAVLPLGDGFSIVAEGRTHQVDAVVLATGGLPAPPLPPALKALVESGCCIDDPWRSEWESRLREDSRVVVIGSGLSMIDHVQRIHASGVVPPVTALSRHGLLPQPHLTARQPPATLSGKLDRAAGSGSLRVLLAALRDECDAGHGWQTVMDAFRGQAARSWHALPEVERRRFLRHLRSYWDVHRHRLSPAQRARVDAWIESGWLVVRAARLVGARTARKGVKLDVLLRGGSQTEEIAADLVLRASGRDGPCRPGGLPVIDRLLELGRLQPDPLGLGLDVDAHGQPRGRDGQPARNVWVLGSAARGRDWEATAIPELRAAAARAAVSLLDWAHGNRRRTDPP